MSTPEFKEKSKQTLMKKYGVDNAMQNQDIKTKVIKTKIKKYGNDWAKLQHEKCMKTCIEKYNVKNIMHSEIMLKQSFDYLKIFEKYVIPLFDFNEWEGHTDKIYKWKCQQCGNVFEQKMYKSTPKSIKDINYDEIPRCFNCFPYVGSYSYKENDLMNFIKEFYPNAHKDKKLIYPLELDIVIDELKLAIEFNGIYWHSENHFSKSNIENYHYNKMLKCNEKGYRLIQIWEDDWDNNNEQIKNRLKIILNNEEKFNDDELILDRCWFNGIILNGYNLIEEIPPYEEYRNGFKIKNCGFLKFKKII